MQLTMYHSNQPQTPDVQYTQSHGIQLGIGRVTTYYKKTSAEHPPLALLHPSRPSPEYPPDTSAPAHLIAAIAVARRRQATAITSSQLPRHLHFSPITLHHIPQTQTQTP